MNPTTGAPLPVKTSRDRGIEPLDLNAKWGERYTIGCDLGQSHDPTAIAVVRRIEEYPAKPVFQCGHLERLPLGTSYPTVVGHVTHMLGRPQFRGKTELVIDMTGVGRPVFDLFVSRGISPIGVTITAGEATSNEGLVWRVPKIILISRIQALLHDGRLKIHKELPDAAALVAELQDFRADVTNSGYWKFGARAGKHDDLVLALAIALWRAHGDNSHAKWMDYMRRVGSGAYSVPNPTEQKPRVTLKSPINITTIYLISGRALNVAQDGTVEVNQDDAIPLLQAGWQIAT